MKARRGKLVALWAGVLGIAVLVATGIALKDRIREEYWLWVLENGDEPEKAKATGHLAALGSERAVTYLLNYMVDVVASLSGDGDYEHEDWLLRYWASVGREALPPLLRFWEGGGDKERFEVRCALGAMDSSVTVLAAPHFLRALVEGDDDSRKAAPEFVAVAGWKDEETIRALEALASHPDEDVRHRAEEALRNIRPVTQSGP